MNRLLLIVSILLFTLGVIWVFQPLLFYKIVGIFLIAVNAINIENNIDNYIDN